MAGTVLALDLATVVGWCVGAPGAPPRYGSVRLEGRERPARYAALTEWLDDALRVHGFTRIFFEAPNPSGSWDSRDAALLTLGLVAHLELWAWDNSVALACKEVGTIRKAVLGRGGAFGPGGAKPFVARWAASNGFKGGDDNALDALVAWMFATGYRPQGSIAA